MARFDLQSTGRGYEGTISQDDVSVHFQFFLLVATISVKNFEFSTFGLDA